MTLGIYIPTYNRPAELRAQLNRLVPQLTPEVFVRVQDNGSTSYSWKDLARDFSHPQVEFCSNAGNIGANANIALGFPLMGHHEYLWILSDNDLLVSNAIATILEQLKDSPDLVIFGKPAGDRTVLEPAGQGWNDNCPGLISEAVYRSSKYLPYLQNAFLYHNTSFPHLAIYYSARLKEAVLAKYSSVCLFEDQELISGAKGNYTLSISGMPQICLLLPPKERAAFLKNWLNDLSGSFFSLNNPELRFVAGTTRSILIQHVPLSYGRHWCTFVWRQAKSRLKALLRRS